MTLVEDKEQAELPYNGQPVFSYQPEDGSDPIIFPKSSVILEDVDGVKAIKFLWKLRKLNEAYQSFEFMDRAKVPDVIQERVLDLSYDERRKFFRAWFADINEPPKVGIPPES